MQFTRKQKVLCFGDEEISLLDVAKKCSRPTYVYDQAAVESRALDYRRALSGFKNSQIHVAIKANSFFPLLQGLAKNGFGIDAVSGGEIALALEAGFAPDKIIFSGVGKSEGELRLAVENGLRQINIESLPEIERLIRVCGALQKKIAVSLRLNPGFEVDTHPYIKTGTLQTKFGLHQTQVTDALRLIKNCPDLRLVGLSFHLGSQLMDHSFVTPLVELAARWMKDILDEGFAIDRLDLGGGLGIDYFAGAGDADLARLSSYVRLLTAAHEKFLQPLLPDLHLQFEPGRWIFAQAGCLLAQVEYVKKTPDKNFLILNTGIHHLIRPALYNAHHRIFPVVDRSGDLDTFEVVGPLCESSDVLGRDVKMATPVEGDWIAIADCGAYGFEMASRYNLHDWPDRILLAQD
jgi:diaminopimelate decarboxylase